MRPFRASIFITLVLSSGCFRTSLIWKGIAGITPAPAPEEGAGSRDASFNGGEPVLTALGDADSEAFALLLYPASDAQNAGKILLAGNASVSGQTRLALARYLPDGSLDPSFNPSGARPGTLIESTGSASAELHGLRYQSGKVVGVGDRLAVGAIREIFLLRYSADGTRDETFNNGTGITVFNSPGTNTYGTSLAQDAVGNLLASGWADHPSSADEFLAIRLFSTGAPDSGFGNSGMARASIGDSDGVAASILEDSRFHVVVWGRTKLTANTLIGIVDFGLSGSSPDSSTPAPVQTSAVNRAILGTGGRALTAGPGTKIVEGSGFLVARWAFSLALDTNFAPPDGFLHSSFGTATLSEAWDLAVQSDGKILSAGETTRGTQTFMALSRCSSVGAPDTSFGNSGVASYAVGSGSAVAKAMAIQPDGKILMGGYAYNSENKRVFALTRVSAN